MVGGSLYYPGIVESNTASTGRAGDVKYTVRFQHPELQTGGRLVSVKPVRDLPDDIEIAAALEPGAEVLVVQRGSRFILVLIDRETFAIEECE